MSFRNPQLHPNGFRLSYLVVVPVAVLLLTGCMFGPQQLKDGHLAYNETVRLASDKELLLNIVRLRYLDTIEFMSISSISSQLSFSVGVGTSLGEETGQSTNLGLGEAAWASRPTFTFAPQRGGNFARMVTTPVPLSVLTDLAAADWNIPILFQLMTQDVNGNENLTGFISPKFLEFTALLGDLQNRADLYFGTMETREKISDPIQAGYVSGTDLVEAAKEGYRFDLTPDGKQYVLTRAISQPVLYIPEKAPEQDRLYDILHLKETLPNPYIELRPGKYPEEALTQEIDFIMVNTRSILDTIAYLAGGVDVPASHISNGLVSENWFLSGQSSVDVKELLRIHVSESRPEATLAIRHRGYWFYLADNDKRSKLTFLSLAEILRMALSPSEDSKAPILTLPVGR